MRRCSLFHDSSKNYFSKIPKKEFFKVVEVGARDGLQNEKNVVSTADKTELINKLSNCGLRSVEATSFVSPKWVPQLADHNEVIQNIIKKPGVAYPVLVPNMAGLKNALSNGHVKEIAVFGAASESFSRKNVNCSIEESLSQLEKVTKEAKLRDVLVRGYVSCVIACPYDGPTSSSLVARITKRLLDAGCYEVSLGDTIGIGSAGSVGKMLDAVLVESPIDCLAVHFHDTYGQALANCLLAIERGVRVADSSIAGLGGCPYAKGATGNLATEDLVYLLHGLGFETGVNFDELVAVSDWICTKMQRSNASRVANAVLANRKKPCLESK